MYIPSKRGKKLLFVFGHTYSLTRANYANGDSRWACSLNGSTLKCSARIRMQNDGVLDVLGTHSHKPPNYQINQKGQYVRM